MFKQDFPIFQHHPKLIYLDSAASAQKPQCVLDAISDFYAQSYSNVHRGNCDLAAQSTTAYETAREIVAGFIGAKTNQIIFTSGATMGINLVANGLEHQLQSEDEVVVCIAEHHANFVPWQQVCLRTNAVLKCVKLLPDGRIDMDDLKSQLSARTKIVAVAHQSNVLGILNPVEEIVRLSHQYGALVLVDGSQSIAHVPINVSQLDCDYFVFSGHKLYGPTGIGVLYGKTDALNILHPTVFGGDMVKTVSVQETTFADLPARLEAGTPPFVQAIGLSTAISYIAHIGMEVIHKNETELMSYLLTGLHDINGLKILGSGTHNCGLVSFVIAGIHPADIAFALSKQNICVRVGHHCAMPVHTTLGEDVSLRVSLGLYNDKSDIDAFLLALKKTVSFFM